MACIRTPRARATSRRRSGNTSNRWPKRSRKNLPNPTRVDGRHRRAVPAAESLPELRQVLQDAVGAPAAGGMHVLLRPAAEILVCRVLAPHLGVGNEEPLVGSK